MEEFEYRLAPIKKSWIRCFLCGLLRGYIRRPAGGEVEYLYRIPVSRRRRRKGNPMPGGKLSHPVPGGYKYGDLA
jgi:hypothetical protein